LRRRKAFSFPREYWKLPISSACLPSLDRTGTLPSPSGQRRKSCEASRWRATDSATQFSCCNVIVFVDAYRVIPTEWTPVLGVLATKTTHEKQLMRLVRKHKLLRARDLAEQGLATIGLTRLVQAGKLDRVARGLYALPGAAMSEHRSLAEVPGSRMIHHPLQ
jgi:Transcriptional regulator, AbiEi antitoxin